MEELEDYLLVLQVKHMLAINLTVKEITEATGFSTAKVKSIKYGKTHNHIIYINNKDNLVSKVNELITNTDDEKPRYKLTDTQLMVKYQEQLYTWDGIDNYTRSYEKYSFIYSKIKDMLDDINRGEKYKLLGNDRNYDTEKDELIRYASRLFTKQELADYYGISTSTVYRIASSMVSERVSNNTKEINKIIAKQEQILSDIRAFAERNSRY